MKFPRNEKERILAIERIVKKLSAEQQRVLYQELTKFELLEQAARIDKAAPKHHLTIQEIVEECRTVRKRNYKKEGKPSDFGGLWKDRDIDAEQLRNHAWDNRGI